MPDSASKRRWDAENTTIFSLKLNNRTDADILSALEGKPRQTEIKRLIRAALAAEGAERERCPQQAADGRQDPRDPAQ